MNIVRVAAGRIGICKWERPTPAGTSDEPQVEKETDPAKRRELVRTVSKIIAEKAYGFGLFSRIRYHAWHPQVKGHAPNANFGLRPWPTVMWLDK